ncbi:hypothetical protein [Pseudomonas sp. EpS/L25]|uniref:hypothetical protein n=1 Tax=Pseudomonas sp. EpS/L25 TaxID=1749078 RepID=UPI0007439698|nr:hypothetical protein [Pseudomonas sp. EpS/L25]KUM41887.1 hypothetical protein AR540_06595 [Pseudomonas sp. EpS/L25]
MRRSALLPLLLLLGLSGCAVRQPVSPPPATAAEFGRSSSWLLQARLHSALYGCELLVLNGNNARLAGEQERLPGFRRQLGDCQGAAATAAREATHRLPSGQDRLLRNAQKTYLATWQAYLASLNIEHPADLQRKESYLRARAALLEAAAKESEHPARTREPTEKQLTIGS